MLTPVAIMPGSACSTGATHGYRYVCVCARFIVIDGAAAATAAAAAAAAALFSNIHKMVFLI